MSSIAQVAVPYAMLALQDASMEITEDNINKMLQAAKITVEPVWVKIFVQAFAGKDINEFLTSISAGASTGSAPVAAAASSAAAAAPVAAASKKEVKKEESEDEDMGFGLFD